MRSLRSVSHVDARPIGPREPDDLRSVVARLEALQRFAARNAGDPRVQGQVFQAGRADGLGEALALLLAIPGAEGEDPGPRECPDCHRVDGERHYAGCRAVRP